MNSIWNFSSDRPLDVICMGRVAVDFYSEQIGCSLENAQIFRKYLGGCAGNIAVGTSRLTLRSAMLSCVGSDAMGQFLKQELQKEGVDISLLQETNRHLTGLVILGISPPDRFPLIFYRQNCADMQINEKKIDPKSFVKAKALLITGTLLSTKPMRNTTHYCVDLAKAQNTRVIFDLDFRPVLWGLTKEGDGESRYKPSARVSRHYQKMLPQCDLIVGTEDEILIAGNARSIEIALQKIRLLTNAPIVLKKGEHGCCVYFDDMSHPIIAPGFPVTILNVLGAGDAFLSGFLRGLLRGAMWDQCATYGNACGAIVVTRHGCAPAMPSDTEMLQFISQYKRKK